MEYREFKAKTVDEAITLASTESVVQAQSLIMR